ncbi:MAG: efflux RND transporter permease subunit [Pseudomonadota bacterium]
MTLTRFSLNNPAAIAVLAAILLFLGGLSLVRLPIQLFPKIEVPRISVQTTWRAASPQDVESELLVPMEEVLRGMPGVERMQAWANQGSSWVNLEFGLDANMDEMLIEVISRLNRLPPLPRDAQPPRIFSGGGFNSNNTLIYYFVQKLPENSASLVDNIAFIQDSVIPRIESIEGVSRAGLGDGDLAQEQLQITFDPYRLAQFGLSIDAIAGSIANSSDVSGGQVEYGRRRVSIYYEGQYSAERLQDLIIEWRDGRPIRIGDVATVDVRLPDGGDRTTYQNGNPAIGMRIDRETGANVLATLEKVNAIIAELNDTTLKERGLWMEKSFDPSVFIKRAVGLLTNNLAIGICLAIGALWLFLRRIRATLLIAVAIPLSLFGTFVVLSLAGRTLNVISLAGLAFATGMVLDAAIVVLENIVRLRERGLDKAKAAEVGTTQVWGALLASTSTTVAIFVPVMFLKDAEGQLFADLAFTIAVSVVISLIVAVTVLPAASKQLLRTLPKGDAEGKFWERIASVIMAITGTRIRRASIIAGLIAGSLGASWVLLPELDYLPPVKRDAVDAWINVPGAMPSDLVDEEISKPIVERLQPFMTGEREPRLRNYYVINNPWGISVGIRALDQSRVKELETIVRDEILVGMPDVFAFAAQGNLFGGFGGDGGLELHIQGRDPETLAGAAQEGFRLLMEAFPGARIQSNPDPDGGSPQLSITPNDQRIMEMGMTRAGLANIIRTLGEGRWLGEHFDGEKRLDIILRGIPWRTPAELRTIPITAPNGQIVPLGELVDVALELGPSAIQRVDGRRTITLELSVPDGMPLSRALEVLEAEVLPKLRLVLPEDGSTRYGGSADALKRAISTMIQNFAVALFLLFMIMAALFKSVKDALLVVISIPLATVGGVVALRIVALFAFAPLDLLTMIGFIILLGLVVNNAILLVVETRRGESEGLTRDDAVGVALKLRLRPIFMSTGTSLLGMLPLLLFPGEGSAIYRGMAAAIVGGMSVSTLFTLFLLPSLLRANLGTLLPFLNRRPKVVPPSAPAE